VKYNISGILSRHCQWRTSYLNSQQTMTSTIICYAHMNLNYTIFVDFFSLCKKYWASNPCIVSFVD